MVRKFRTNLKVVFGLSLWFLIMLISALSSPNVKIIDPVFLVVAFVLVLIIITITFGNYVTIFNNHLSTVDGFLFKQSVDINDILHVSYGPQLVGGMGAKMLTVYRKKNNQIKALNVGSNHFFSQQTLVNIIVELKKTNPSIRLDENAEDLLKKFGHN
jgi:hypothetical protein